MHIKININIIMNSEYEYEHKICDESQRVTMEQAATHRMTSLNMCPDS